MPSELKQIIIWTVLTALSFYLPGGRVLVIPFVFVIILAAIFWSARVSAEREE